MRFANTIAFINPKSGGKHGSKVYSKLCILLGKDHVFDLSQGGPESGLRRFRKHENLRVIACGGDGTVGWIHSWIDRIKFLHSPAVVPFPLGTGNDMSRVLGWGANYAGEAIVPLLQDIEAGIPVKMDRWMVCSEPLEEADLLALQALLCRCDKIFAADFVSSSACDELDSANMVPMTEMPPRLAVSDEDDDGSSSPNRLLSSSSSLASSPQETEQEVKTASQSATKNNSSSSNRVIPITPPVPRSSQRTISPLKSSTPTPSWLSQRKLRFLSASEIPTRTRLYEDDKPEAITDKSPSEPTVCNNPEEIAETTPVLPHKKSSKKKKRNLEVSEPITPDTDPSQVSTLTDSTVSLPAAPIIEPEPKKARKKTPKIESTNVDSIPSPSDSLLEETMSTATAHSEAPSDAEATLTPKVKSRKQRTAISASSSDLPLPGITVTCPMEQSPQSLRSTAEPALRKEPWPPTLGEYRAKERRQKMRSSAPAEIENDIQVMNQSVEGSSEQTGLEMETLNDALPTAESPILRTSDDGPRAKKTAKTKHRLATSTGSISESPRKRKGKTIGITKSSDLVTTTDKKPQKLPVAVSLGDLPDVVSQDRDSIESDRSLFSPREHVASQLPTSRVIEPRRATSDTVVGIGVSPGANAGPVSLRRIPDLEQVASTSSLKSSSKKTAERKTLVMNNYFSVGVDSMVALEFHNMRESMPGLFPHHVINKAWYGVYGLKHAMLNLSKKPDLRRVLKLELDGSEVQVPKGVEAIVFLQIPSYSSGTNVWGAASKTKGQISPPTIGDGLFEVVGLKGVMHLGALQAGWSSGIRLGQAQHAVLYNLAVVPVQCDGEPWLLPPCKTTIDFQNQSTMLFNIAKNPPKRYKSLTGNVLPALRFPDDEIDYPEEIDLEIEAGDDGAVTNHSETASTEMESQPQATSSEKPIVRTKVSESEIVLPSDDSTEQGRLKLSSTKVTTSDPKKATSSAPATSSATFSAQEFRNAMRVASSSTLQRDYHDIPARIRDSRKSISSVTNPPTMPIPTPTVVSMSITAANEVIEIPTTAAPTTTRS